MTSVQDSTAAEAPDIHTTAGKLANLRSRREAAMAPSGEAAIEKVHAKGKLTARERITALLDEGSFVEMDALARHRSQNFGMAENRPFGDGVVTGYGTVDGRDVCVFSQDATVFGGSLGEIYGEKIVKVMDLAIKTGRPLIGINEGAGARIQEGVVSLGLYGEIFHRNVQASGVIPQISLIMGPAAGGHVYSPALTDFVVMVDGTSQMFVTGPDVIKTVTGENVTMEELGGAHTHMEKSGVAHYVASGEQDALDYVRDLLGYLPSNNRAEAPRMLPSDPISGAIEDNLTDEDLELDTLIPDSPNTPYDMHEVIRRILDDDEFLDQLGGQVFDRCVDQLRAVIGGDNLHPFGKARLQLFEFGFHCRNRAPRVGSLPQDDDTACNLAFTVQLGDAAPQFRTDLDIRDIAERDRHAARFGAQRNAAEIRQSSEITRCTDHIFRFAHLDN